MRAITGEKDVPASRRIPPRLALPPRSPGQAAFIVIFLPLPSPRSPRLIPRPRCPHPLRERHAAISRMPRSPVPTSPLTDRCSDNARLSQWTLPVKLRHLNDDRCVHYKAFYTQLCVKIARTDDESVVSPGGNGRGGSAHGCIPARDAIRGG